ncbi:MAG: 50S ribosomal protein L3 [Christensenellaceae bacterium]|jgi:large subunit ribosomal protein L3|nr:50S ribosomal protein L3 [Christensenellaceae bacterium]
MNKAILGYKLGMTRYFTPSGVSVPVTVVQAGPCRVIGVLNKENTDHDAIKVGFGAIKASHLDKPTRGQLRKANAALTPEEQKSDEASFAVLDDNKIAQDSKTVVRHFKEFRLTDTSKYKVGDLIKADTFAAGEFVDVTGTSKGRGFTGTVQRWGTHIGPKAHGSGYHRGVGSLSANSTPSRVFKNKVMPGQYGNETSTIQNLEIIKVDVARNLLLIAGGIPGPKKGLLIIQNSCKKKPNQSHWAADKQYSNKSDSGAGKTAGNKKK